MTNFKEMVVEEISKVTNLEKTRISENIEVPKDSTNGDFAFPCFMLAKELKKAPAMIATDLQINISENLKTNNLVKEIE